jgi:hypothetical protein
VADVTAHTTLSWNRIEAFGAELALISDAPGLHASGWALGAAPTPYTCHYTLETDDRWRTIGLDVQTEGAGWSRSLRLARRPGSGGWRVRASETGELAAPPPGAEYPEAFEDALDIDLGYSPLTNTLPIRRLGLLDEAPGTEHEITVAWVEVPSLAVIANVQRYTPLGDGRFVYRSANYRAEITVDPAGYVVRYPGLATAENTA